MSERTWKILPFFLLRSTGFPFSWLERLTFTETSTTLDVLLACEDELAALAIKLQDVLHADPNTESFKLRRSCWDCIHHNRSIRLNEQLRRQLRPELSELAQQWNKRLAERDELEVAARQIFSQEIVSRRQVLRDIATDPGFQEAVWLSSPQMFAHGLQSYLKGWHPHKRPSKIRRIERQIVSYLQRFCAKNDTTSFFGPINYGDFAPPDDTLLPGPGAQHVQRREAFIAYWAVSALAEVMTADPDLKPYLCPYRSPLYRLDIHQNGVNMGIKRTLVLTPHETQLFQLADGWRTMTEIARQATLSLEETVTTFERLAETRIVYLLPYIPVTTLNALTWLLDWVRALPDACRARSNWCQLLEKFKYLQDRFTSVSLAEKQAILAELENLLTEATNRSPRRGGGKFYADRLLIYEECLGGLTSLSLGPTFASELKAQLTPILDLFAAHACDVHRQQQAYGAELLTQLAPKGQISFLRLVSQLHQKKSIFEASPSPWQAAIQFQLETQAQEKQVQIDLNTLPPIDREQLSRMPLLTSPDVMLLAHNETALRTGDFQVILAECHDTLMIWGWSLYFHPSRHGVEAATARLLKQTSGDKQLANVLTSRRVKIVPFEYPGPTIEMMTRSQKPTAESIAITDVTAIVEGGRPALQAPGWPNLMLYNGELLTLAHSIFAPPRVVPPYFDTGIHTPRVTLGKAVLQRERWRPPPGTLFPGRYQGISFELMYDFRRAARDLGLPRYLFASITNELKPVFIDCDNYFLLEMLHYLVGKRGEVVLSEMLPAPNQLWLRDKTDAFCAELRLSTFYVPTQDEITH